VLMAMRPSELKELVATFRELSLSYEEFGSVSSGVVDKVRPLKHLIGEPNVKAKGSWLIKAGMALIAFPDPTVSDFIGAALVAAGLIKNKMKQITAVDVYRKFREVIGKLEDITQELAY